MKMKILILLILTSLLSCKGNYETSNSKKEQISKINIQTGSGKFIVAGGYKKTDSITIHYYKPKNFTAKSPVIYVVPGAGRNGDDYRDAWIEKSKKYNILVLSPEYSEIKLS